MAQATQTVKANTEITESDRLKARIAELEEQAKTGPRVAEPDNVEMTLDGHILTIRLDLTKDSGVSQSGKTRVVATTRGNKRFDIPKVGAVFVGVNAYKKPNA